MNSEIVYSTNLGGSYNLMEAEHNEALRKERLLLMEWEFSDPVSLEEEHDLEECEETFLTEEDLQLYDDLCEEHWERRLQQIQLDQEY